ncbi:transglutaminase-like cysteine peptidase [Desulfobulbus propionicus]|jgi:predicted transglutaminase-like cysteine proteinase
MVRARLGNFVGRFDPTANLTRVVWGAVCLLLHLLTFEIVFSANFLALDEGAFDWAEKRYGSPGRNRLLAWQNLIQTNRKDDWDTVQRVNIFVNTFLFTSDVSHWGRDDYWATPVEFFASGGGDCEDFAIAKYFTLTTLGIASDQLTLIYVKALRLNQSHLVLAYSSSPGKEPLILDNLTDAIQPSSRRTDLYPIYSFNVRGLWEAKQRGQGKMIGDSRKIRPWRELLTRMKQGRPTR